MLTRHTNLLRPALWDLSQKVFGADSEKERLYFEVLNSNDRSMRILDFGCATGNASGSFIGYDYTGIDIDAALIALAKLKFRRHPEMKFLAEDIFDYKPAEPFDSILFAGVAHHLDDQLLRKVLTQLHTLLSEKGHIYFIDPVITRQEGPLLKLLMSLDQGKFHRPAEAYQRVFEQLGFKVLESRPLLPKGALFPTPECVFFKIR